MSRCFLKIVPSLSCVCGMVCTLQFKKTKLRVFAFLLLEERGGRPPRMQDLSLTSAKRTKQAIPLYFLMFCVK